MKLLVLVCLVMVVGLATASVLPFGIAIGEPPALGVGLQGPAAKATIVGPDGSIVTGGGVAGAIAAPGVPGGIVGGVVAPAVLAGPALIPGPFPLHGIGGGAVIAGPSGTVFASGGLGGASVVVNGASDDGSDGDGDDNGGGDDGSDGGDGGDDGSDAGGDDGGDAGGDAGGDDGDDGSYKPSGEW